VLLNERGYLEAAHRLGARMLREGGTDDSSRVALVSDSPQGGNQAARNARVTNALQTLPRGLRSAWDDATTL